MAYRRTLTNTTAGHNKWYFVAVEPAPDGTPGWRVMRAWGPIGACHTIDVPSYSHTRMEWAEHEAEQVVAEKMRKGYVVVGDTPGYAMMAGGKPKKIMGLIQRLASSPVAVRFLRTMLQGLSEAEISQITTADLKVLLMASSKEARLTGLAIAAEVASRRAPSPTS